MAISPGHTVCSCPSGLLRQESFSALARNNAKVAMLGASGGIWQPLSLTLMVDTIPASVFFQIMASLLRVTIKQTETFLKNKQILICMNFVRLTVFFKHNENFTDMFSLPI